MKWLLLALWLAATSATAQTVTAGSVNTPSGYSIDLTTGNVLQYDSSLKTNSGWYITGTQGSFTQDGYTFSYAPSTLEQTFNLSSIPLSYQNTSAVYVTGMSYGFKYRFQCANSIGGSCDNTSGPQDTLNATFTYYNHDGTVGYSQYYGLGSKNQNDGNSAYNPVWQQLADTYTLSGAKPLSAAGSAKLSITGQDAGFWACLGSECYGPQIKDAYLNINYSVDPCILNPAYSPSCAGFSAVIQYGQSPFFTGSYYIPTSLPHIGGGVQLHGYEYGFGYYAGDYCTNTFMFWCTSSSGANGRNVSVNITNGAGTSLIYDSWWVSGDYSGGSRYGRVLFTESQNSLNMGYVSWNVWGGYGDNMGIYAWTRPIWTPDPCYTQPLYSPNCSNFDVEIKRLADEQNKIQKANLDTTVASVTTTPTSTITTTIEEPNSTTPRVTTTTTELSPQLVQSSTPIAESNTAKLAARSDVTTQQDSTSLALALIRQNQQREGEIATKASQSAIETANIAAISSIRQAENIALDSARQSTTTQQSTATVETTSQVKSLVAAVLAPATTSISLRVETAADQQKLEQSSQDSGFIAVSPVSIASKSVQQDVVQTSPTSASSVVSIVNTSPVVEEKRLEQTINILQPIIVQQQTISTQQASIYTPPEQYAADKLDNVQEQVGVVIGAVQVNVLQQPQQQVLETKPQQMVSTVLAPVTQVELPVVASNFLTDKANPIGEIIDSKPVQPEAEQTRQNQQVVKQNVQDNDAAVGVSISSIAVVPVGFNAYTIALADAQFYPPKEIYRNQRVVDNQRVLRQLGTDRLHQEMIELQYRSAR